MAGLKRRMRALSRSVRWDVRSMKGHMHREINLAGKFGVEIGISLGRAFIREKNIFFGLLLIDKIEVERLQFSLGIADDNLPWGRVE